MIPGVCSKQYEIEEAMLDNRKLINFANGEFILGRAIKIDWENKNVICENTINEIEFFNKILNTNEFKNIELKDEDKIIKVPFDILCIDIGSKTRSNNLVKGVKEYAISTRPISKFEFEIRNFEKNYKSDNTPDVIIIGGGAAGIEIALTLQERFKIKYSFDSNSNFTIINAKKDFKTSLNGNQISNKVISQLKLKNIKYLQKVKVKEIKKNSILLDNGEEINFDLCIWATGAAPHKFSKGSKLTLEKGFIQVNNYLQSTSHPNVFAAGDCISFKGNLLPKAGVYAVREGPILTKNILKYVNQLRKPENKIELTEYHPQQNFLKLINFGDGRAAGDYYGWAYKGKIMWKLKDYIDKGFMNTFPMAQVKHNENSEKLSEDIPLLD
jgi:NADH dehydrogenase FAD-containing subunit